MGKKMKRKDLPVCQCDRRRVEYEVQYSKEIRRIHQLPRWEPFCRRCLQIHVEGLIGLPKRVGIEKIRRIKIIESPTFNDQKGLFFTKTPKGN